MFYIVYYARCRKTVQHLGHVQLRGKQRTKLLAINVCEHSYGTIWGRVRVRGEGEREGERGGDMRISMLGMNR